jgi:hypothetical protein
MIRVLTSRNEINMRGNIDRLSRFCDTDDRIEGSIPLLRHIYSLLCEEILAEFSRCAEKAASRVRAR